MGGGAAPTACSLFYLHILHHGQPVDAAWAVLCGWHSLAAYNQRDCYAMTADQIGLDILMTAATCLPQEA